MQILKIDFEQHLYIQHNDEIIKLVCFPTQDPYVIKIGVDASKNISIHREEIYVSIQSQKTQTTDSETIG